MHFPIPLTECTEHDLTFLQDHKTDIKWSHCATVTWRLQGTSEVYGEKPEGYEPLFSPKDDTQDFAFSLYKNAVIFNNSIKRKSSPMFHNLYHWCSILFPTNSIFYLLYFRIIQGRGWTKGPLKIGDGPCLCVPQIMPSCLCIYTCGLFTPLPNSLRSLSFMSSYSNFLLFFLFFFLLS